MTVQPLEMLEHVEATMGIRLVRDGESLRILARPGVDIEAANARVRSLKAILHEEVLQREIVEIACRPADHFDRGRFNALFMLWRDTYGLPWDTPADMLPSDAIAQYEAMRLGA